MRQGLVVDNFPLLPKIFHDVIDFDRVPIKYGVGDKAQAACLVHDLFVIAGGEFTLVGKENPSRQFVPIFALIELPLHRSA